MTPIILLDADATREVIGILYVPKSDVDEAFEVIEKVKQTVDCWTVEDIKEAVTEHEGWHYDDENFASIGV